MFTKDEHRKALKSFEIDRLLKMLSIESKKRYDGHYTVLSFTSGFKVAFGTPNLDGGTGREEIKRLPSFPTLKDAVIDALVSESDLYAEIDAAQDIPNPDEPPLLQAAQSSVWMLEQLIFACECLTEDEQKGYDGDLLARLFGPGISQREDILNELRDAIASAKVAPVAR